ncbi:lipid-A-disaccharide synthase [Desulfovibrio sp. OttesenSCG-928-I05]|nr:lipid-A-disaccharide synthase [Desulfovibrio sp. OttesenSCG-928-I05]
MNNAPLLWISAGELSGDMHAAKLASAILKQNPDVRFAGIGGPHLRNMNSFTSYFKVEELSVMGIGEVLMQLPGILKLLGRVREKLAELRPAALIVVDAPSFNFRVIKMARELDIPVYYYISPKIWAWKQKRALFLKKNVRRLISILPFEQDFYKRFDMEISYVGNPLVDMIDWPRMEGISPTPGRIGILPGSRKKEISSLMPEFGKAAALMLRERPDLKFTCAVAPGVDKDWLRSFWPGEGDAGGAPLELIPPDDRYAFMRGCEMLMAASGTVTLEAALLGTPTIVAYKVSPLTWFIGKRLIRVPYLSLSNLILGRELFPELLQEESSGENLAARALAWLTPDAEGKSPLQAVREELKPLRRIMGEAGRGAGEGGGSTDLAASVILEDMRAMGLNG